MSGLLTAADVRAGTVVDVAGLTVRVAAADDLRAEAVASLVREAPAVDADGGVDCDLVHAVDPPALPRREPDLDSEAVRRWRADGVLHVAAGDTVARADATSIVVGGGGAAASEFRNVTVHALGHCFAERGRLLVHGCGVVTEAGVLLVVGESGVGKSTLAWAAIRSGRTVLSDDIVVLDPPDGLGTVWAVGLPRPVAVPADVVGAGTAVPDGRPVPGDPRSRTEVPAGCRHPGRMPVAGLVVAVGADPLGAAVVPGDGPEALRAVLRSTLAFADPYHRAAAFATAGALARTATWELRRGSDPVAALVEATDCLEQLVTALAGDAPG